MKTHNRRAMGKLTALEVQHITQRGCHGDGGGLYLRVSGSGGKSWIFRFRDGGRVRDMGLGGLGLVGLAEARKLAAEARAARYNGASPIDVRDARQQQNRLNTAKATGRTLPAPASDCVYLYRHFDQTGALLYVGIALNHLARLKHHNDQSSWFNEIAIVTIEHFATKEEAEGAEHAAIRLENPRYNIHGGIRIAARKLRSHTGNPHPRDTR